MAKRSLDVDASDDFRVPTHLTASNIVVRLVRLWVLFGVIVLGLRVFLLAFSANQSTPFVTFVYETSSRYLEPFRGIFPAREVGESGYFDVSAVFAIIIYLLIAWAVAALVSHVELKMETARLEAEKARREHLAQVSVVSAQQTTRKRGA
jgi:uncharacterized protein YggT (Ycf19 family)